MEDDGIIVTVNVGGMKYTTQLGTLRTHENSILAAMFSSPIAVPRDTRDGSFFIDRNGSVFGLILDYLRSGTLVVPRDPVQYTVLRREVNFYGLPIALQLPQIQPTLWESAPKRFRHARIVADELDKVVEWEEGPLPDSIYTRTLSEIVSFFSAKGYRIASEYTSRGSKGLVSIWMIKKEMYSGADVGIEVTDPV
jgi:hypothetical protein